MLQIESGKIGSYRVNRAGFGAMQLPGPGVFGPPADRETALAVLRRSVDLGVNHIDTAQYYGPDVANELIHTALYPYPSNLVIVSKVGARRDESGGWLPASQPQELRSGVEANLRALDVDQVHVVNLRVGEAGPPDQLFDERLAAMMDMRDEGLIGGIGLSNVSLEQFERAVSMTEVACVQNAFNVFDRSSNEVLQACEGAGVAFVPFFPLGSGFPGARQVVDDPTIQGIAARLNATPAQVALAWLLALSSSILLIPGTSSLNHLEENMATANVSLDDEAMAVLDARHEDEDIR
jgi:aryl-alcohol dehydrogenase-like predicted oxidoreductase